MRIMAGMMELKGCRIIVKEIAGGKRVLDTRIKSYDPIRKVVKVSAGSLDNRMEHAVTVIIFGPNGSLVEATGNLRKVIIANEVEIELGRSKNGEKRKHARYPLKEKGYIESVIVDGTLIELQKPIEMETCNISGNGILIQTMAGSGTVGTELRICVKLGDTMLQKTYRIVRIQNANLKTEEYGCMMIRDRNI
ncbi:PilZ domain-containing protein [Roseburia sp. AF20-18LB]|nr:PilZ domain-containing protein [Roseburia sp. AF20-18LB]